ncbi:uncharacterized protein LOC135484250 [Lineus longissimus]|uniref:uncharacterized protein LOC135484250 n=1 Tax=Lineus longissimus TaxID=88925 RepID=UPI002B4D187F
MAKRTFSPWLSSVALILACLVQEALGQTDNNNTTKVALGVTFGILAVIILVVFGFFKVYGGMVRRAPTFLHDRPDPEGVEGNSVYLRWGVSLSKTESYAVKVRHYVLFFKNEAPGAQSAPCTVLVPGKPDGSGDYTHQGVKKGDRLVFWVLAIYMSRLPLCIGMHEGNSSKKVYYKGVSKHYDPNEDEDLPDEATWPIDGDTSETGPLTA